MEDDVRVPGARKGLAVRRDGFGKQHRQQQRPNAPRRVAPGGGRPKGNDAPPPPHHGGSKKFKKKAAAAAAATSAKTLCWDWSRRGECPQLKEGGGGCRYVHILQRMAAIEDAHRRGIYAMCSTIAPPKPEVLRKCGVTNFQGIVQLFTASQDLTLKQWLLVPDPAPDGSMKLWTKLAKTWNMQSPVLSCIFFGNMVACGLKNGKIKLVDLDMDTVTDIEGHTDEVQALRVVENKLVSCDWAGNMIVWTPDPVNRTFVRATSISLDSRVTCFVEVTDVNPLTQEKRWELWVGCQGKIKIVNLAALHETPKELEIVSNDTKKKGSHSPTDSRPLVMSLAVLDGHVICAFLSLGIRVFRVSDRQAIKRTEVNKDLMLCAMEGSLAASGPVLLCGSPRGRLTVLSLPSLEEVAYSKIQDSDVRAVHNIGGQPSFFATATMNGKIEIWFWKQPPAEPAPMR